MLHFHGENVIDLRVNGRDVSVKVRPSDLLLTVLRRQLGLTGTKIGCENGDCGACTILLDGCPIKSCLMLALEAVGHEITTIEGLENTPIQNAFVEKEAFQCGYCTPGFIMVSHALLQHHPNPDDYTIESWLQSNLCRCTSYQEIKDAVISAVKNNAP
ncbi:(2Fe-2S)-binding protein [Oscillospiraceae bacterium WX1]